MAALLGELLDLLLPRRCVGCDRPGVSICPTCVRGDERRLTAAGLAVHAAAGYRGAIRAAVISYKERARADLRRPLAGLLAQAMRAALTDGAVTGAGTTLAAVPVPSSRPAVRRRGEDVVRRLVHAATQGIARDLEPAISVVPALRLARPVLDSAGLSVTERARNLAGAMVATEPGGGRLALIVDDVCTTGATVAEAARALDAAGWRVLGAAVVAATPSPMDAGAAGVSGSGLSRQTRLP